MNFDSGKLLHIGINYVIAPVSKINEKKAYEFQGHLIDAELGITDNKFESDTTLAVRRKPTPLEIRVSTVGPEVAQLLVIAPHPNRAFEVFVEEANCAIDAFIKTWMRQNFQIIKSDATIRHLYDSDREHAFSELWEDRLGMPAETLAVFGKSVLSGGLRFVMPHRDDEEDPKEVIPKQNEKSSRRNWRLARLAMKG